MKKIVTMQDISCIGKCSLTVALPILSSMGIECAILPTAILSTHTMFHNVTKHDLTNTLQPIMQHWKKEGFTFDAIYTGYLASHKQIQIAIQLCDEFPTQHIIVDPCMADNGKLYTGFDTLFVEEMKTLCKKAHIITPNITEASLLLHQPYIENYDEQYIQDTLLQLSKLGASISIITGVHFEEDKIGAYAYDATNHTYHSYFTKKETTAFHGTGDIWTSTLTGALTLGFSISKAITIACDFVQLSIHKTLEEPNHNIYGVNFEQAIPYLIDKISTIQ